MQLFSNPHPPYPSDIIKNPGVSTCDLGCAERYIPEYLRKVELFKKVDFLMCFYENDKFSEESMRRFLSDLTEFFRRSGWRREILNWYSLLSWLESYKYTWEDIYAYTSDDDSFLRRYPLSNKEIWLSMSKIMDRDFIEDNYDFWGWMLEPYVGTNLIQRSLLDKLEIEGKVVDWYDDFGIINSYSFVFDEFPGWQKARILIIASKLLKNAESILLALKDERCPKRFLLSISHLDKDYLSDISALRFENVHICFQRYNEELVTSLNYIEKPFFFNLTTITGKLIEYWEKYRLSDNIILDDLIGDKMADRVHCTSHPIKYVQLLPAYSGDPTSWQSGATWEDWFRWGTMDISNLVRERLPYEEKWTDWPSDRTWDHKDYNWVGDHEDWKYYKPTQTLNQYWEDRNLIPSYEPWTGNSLYEVLVFNNHFRILLDNVENNRSKIVLYWDDYELSHNQYISTPWYAPEETREVVVSSEYANIGPHGGPREGIIVVPDLTVQRIITGTHSKKEQFWRGPTISGNIELDVWWPKTAIGNHTTIITDPREKIIQFINDPDMSGTYELDNITSQFVFDRHETISDTQQLEVLSKKIDKNELGLSGDYFSKFENSKEVKTKKVVLTKHKRVKTMKR